MNMSQNTKNIEKNWSELESKIQKKWSKFSKEDLDGFKSDLSQLSSKIEKIYGVAKEEAERQYDSFCKSVESLAGPCESKEKTKSDATPDNKSN